MQTRAGAATASSSRPAGTPGKDEKGPLILYVEWRQRRAARDGQDNPVLDEASRPKLEWSQRGPAARHPPRLSRSGRPRASSCGHSRPPRRSGRGHGASSGCSVHEAPTATPSVSRRLRASSSTDGAGPTRAKSSSARWRRSGRRRRPAGPPAARRGRSPGRDPWIDSRPLGASASTSRTSRRRSLTRRPPRHFASRDRSLPLGRFRCRRLDQITARSHDGYS